MDSGFNFPPRKSNSQNRSNTFDSDQTHPPSRHRSATTGSTHSSIFSTRDTPFLSQAHHNPGDHRGLSPSLLWDSNGLASSDIEETKPDISLNGSPHSATTSMHQHYNGLDFPYQSNSSSSSSSQNSPSSVYGQTASSHSHSSNHNRYPDFQSPLPQTMNNMNDNIISPHNSSSSYYVPQSAVSSSYQPHSRSGPFNPNSLTSSSLGNNSLTPRVPSSIRTQEDFQHEITRLQDEVRRVQYQNEVYQMKIQDLERRAHSGSAPTSSSRGSSSFEASWARRTQARITRLCALNRAGNALCAWHDSRRERRLYPPRNAPPDTLNCGCSHAEALFEESLARHGVGAYLPGESVRMDPALRNPLLKLLEEVWGYKDGDFDKFKARTIAPNGEERWDYAWVAGQEPENWEAGGSAEPGVGSRPARRTSR